MKIFLLTLGVLASLTSYSSDFSELEKKSQVESNKVCMCQGLESSNRFGHIEDKPNLVGVLTYTRVGQYNDAVVTAECVIKSKEKSELRKCEKFQVIDNL